MIEANGGYYRYQGQFIQSEIPLTALAGQHEPNDGTSIDLTIRIGPSPCANSLTPAGNACWLAPGAIAVDIAGVARFTVCEGHCIYVEPAVDMKSAGVEQYLLGTMFALAQMQKGQFCLHAAILSLDGRVIAFCGDSGEGKSTLAMALNQSGWGLLTDDLALLSARDHKFKVAPDGRRVRLRQLSIDALGLSSAPATKVAMKDDKYYLSPALSIQGTDPVELAAICFLDSSEREGEFSLKPVAGMEVLALLNRHTYRSEFLALLGQQQAHLTFSCQLASGVAFYRFSRPRNLSRLGEMVHFIRGCFALANGESLEQAVL